MVFFVSLPATVGLTLLARPLIAAFMERGSFDQQAAADTSAALLGYAVGLTFIAINMLCRVVLFTGGEVKTVLRLGMAEVGLNAVLDASLMKMLGHSGLALATSVSALVMSVFLLRAVARAIGQPLDRALASSVVKALVATGVMAVLVWGTGRLTGGMGPDSFPAGKLGETTLAILVGVLGYGATSAILRTDEMGRMAEVLLRKGRRRA